ncbi:MULTISPECIES: hypothetical protein [Nocardiopsis]|uniref:Uncharacterized protein n=1 Tax=Nocardiopsis changdeensis TaxID=2831969 RepID=A0ABX8BVU0_9ACTN|nr:MULTISPECIES: hypothetical protein [Nocardiopsis]QUX26357.1 hypothetical protein KGD84_32165 [Nocardiopsis changdeensis]QYX40823.1 hypothetical protein K1J57_33010 [Nocardiopsis sp. MT53]
MTTNTPSSGPSGTVSVRLVGGHPRWAGQVLEVPRAEVHDAPLEDVGAFLKIEDGSYPDHLAMTEGVDWRAHYAPVADDDRQVWRFQGWVPS